MPITVPVSLTLAEDAALRARAKAEGVSVDSLLREAVVRLISGAPVHSPNSLTPEEWEKEFAAWIDGMPNFPPLSDEAISRENIYTREDDWR
jgi:hypothetical protein